MMFVDTDDESIALYNESCHEFQKGNYQKSLDYAKVFLNQCHDCFYIGLAYSIIINCTRMLYGIDEVLDVYREMDQNFDRYYSNFSYYNREILPLIFAENYFAFVYDYEPELRKDLCQKAYDYCEIIIRDFQSTVPYSDYLDFREPRFVMDLYIARAYHMLSRKYRDLSQYVASKMLLNRSLVVVNFIEKQLKESELNFFTQDYIRAYRVLFECDFFLDNMGPLNTYLNKMSMYINDETEGYYLFCKLLLDIYNKKYMEVIHRVDDFKKRNHLTQYIIEHDILYLTASILLYGFNEDNEALLHELSKIYDKTTLLRYLEKFISRKKLIPIYEVLFDENKDTQHISEPKVSKDEKYSEILTAVYSDVDNFTSLAISHDGSCLYVGHDEYVYAVDDEGDIDEYPCGIGIFEVTKEKDRLDYDYSLYQRNSIMYKFYRHNISKISLSKDGRFLAAACNNKVEVYHGKGYFFKHYTTFNGHKDKVTSVFVDSDKKIVISSSLDGLIKIWDLEGKKCKTLAGHKGPVRAIAYNQQNKLLISGGDDGTIKTWDIESGRYKETIYTHCPIGALVLSPNGQMFAVSSLDNTITLWSLENDKFSIKLHWKCGTVNAMAFTPDNSKFAYGEDNRIKVYDLTSMKEIQTLSGHVNKVESIAFSPDGQIMYSCSVDAIKLWGLNYTEMKGKITTKVAGVTFEDRQKHIAELRGGMALKLLREPDNPHDSNAICVVREIYDHKSSSTTYAKIGYIPKELARELSVLIDDYGYDYTAFVKEIKGGNGYNYGLVIEIEKGIHYEDKIYDDLLYFDDYDYEKPIDPYDFYYDHGYFPGEDW